MYQLELYTIFTESMPLNNLWRLHFKLSLLNFSVEMDMGLLIFIFIFSSLPASTESGKTLEGKKNVCFLTLVCSLAGSCSMQGFFNTRFWQLSSLLQCPGPTAVVTSSTQQQELLSHKIWSRVSWLKHLLWTAFPSTIKGILLASSASGVLWRLLCCSVNQSTTLSNRV